MSKTVFYFLASQCFHGWQLTDSHGCQLFDVRPYHTQKLGRIDLCTIKAYSYMKESSALCDFLTSNNLGSVRCIGFCYVTVGNFILAIFGYNIVVVNRILSGTGDDTCGNGIPLWKNFSPVKG